MAVRLYRGDSFLWRFNAHVRERLTYEGYPAVTLDQTAFYPTSGGQPFDLGTLNGAPVIDVIERDDGEIVHLLQGPCEGDVVQGEIDSARRIDHMQQHSGQHVLSQAFVNKGGLDTVAVHIGADDCTIDLPTPRLAAEIVDRAEDEANRVIFEDRAVIVKELTDAEVARLPLRKAPKVTGQIRIVEVEGYDWSACGGTHVRSSGQIGMIKITRAEKRSDVTRITFRCGGRALIDYRALNNMAASLSETFSMARADILPAIDRLREEARAARKELAGAQTRLMEYEAQELLRARGDGRRVIARAFDGRDANVLRLMAKLLTVEPGMVALLGGYSGGRAFLCFARSAGATADMAALLRGALAALNAPGAKGGGSPEFAQGSGPAPAVTNAQAAVEWAASQVAG
jgi:alanyl-tRNA synthetase